MHSTLPHEERVLTADRRDGLIELDSLPRRRPRHQPPRDSLAALGAKPKFVGRSRVSITSSKIENDRSCESSCRLNAISVTSQARGVIVTSQGRQHSALRLRVSLLRPTVGRSREIR